MPDSSSASLFLRIRRVTVSPNFVSSAKHRILPPLISSETSSLAVFSSPLNPKGTLFKGNEENAARSADKLMLSFSESAERVSSASEDKTCRDILSGSKLRSVFFKDRSSRRRSHCLFFVCFPSRLNFFRSVSFFGAASGALASSERISYPFRLRARKGKGKIFPILERRISTYLS